MTRGFSITSLGAATALGFWVLFKSMQKQK
ncbi:MAG: PEP-CTERM sorting domain-containing protein [Chlorogloea purpurea SAG 13.99]|nr:PEP-CTERM sorting domain-containing protein [Chlorogloea purpurea SAG 13.99]